MSVRTVQLEEVAEFINGRAFKPTEWGQSGTPIIRIQNLTGTNEAFNYYDGPINERVRVRKGDILISWSASLGVYRWNGEDAVLNQHIFKVRLNDGIDRDYFYYAATDAVQEMASRVHGSTMQHITKDRFDSIHIPLPDLSEQKRIAGLLEQAYRLRRTRRYALELSDTFLAAAFLELFGDPVRNERNWRKDDLGDFTSLVSSGSTPLGGSSIYQKEGVMFVRSQNVLMNELDLSDVARISEDVHARMTRTHVGSGDVLLNITGASIGRVACYELSQPANVNQHVCIIRCNRDGLHPKFLAHQIASQSFQRKILSHESGATRQAFTFEQIKEFRVIVPPLAEQKHFTALVARHERLHANQREAFRQVNHVFQSLLHHAFV